MPIPLRADFDAQMVRSSAKHRRIMQASAFFGAGGDEGAMRTQAARIGATLQIVRDWVMKFNVQGHLLPDRLGPPIAIPA